MTIANNSLGETDVEATRALKIIESMPGHAWSADASGKFTYVSSNALAFLGQVREDLDPCLDEDEFGWRRVVHPDDYDRVAARWRHCLQTGDHYDTEHRLRRADGVYRWFRNSGRPSRDSQGRITEWYGTTIDIDEQKQAETALRDRERELSQLVDMVPVQIRRLTPHGEPTFFNKRLLDFFGLNDVAQLDKPDMNRLAAAIQTLAHPEDAARLLETVRHSLVTGAPYSMKYRVRRADGAYRWVDGRGEPLRDQGGAIVQWFAISIDIDDEVRAQDALRESERQLRQLIDAVPALIWSTTPEGTPSYINKRLIDAVGVTLEDLTAPDASRSLADIHPEDKLAVEQALALSFESGTAFAMAYRQRRSDGGYRWTAGRAEPLRDESGSIVQWYGVCVDIDDRVIAQEALRDRERELSQLVDMVPSLLWRLSPEGEPVFFSKRMIEFLGLDIGDYDKPEMSGLAAALAALVHPDDAGRLAEALNYSFAAGESFSLNCRLRRADGVYRWMSSRGEPLRDESGRILQWYGLCHDIDDQVHVEEALRESEQQLRRLVDALPTQIWAATAEGEPSYLNRRLAEYVGLTLSDLDAPDASRLQMAIQGSVHPDDAVSVGRALAHSFATGETFTMKYRHRRADGVYRWVNGRAEPLRDPGGCIVQWYGVTIDIDDEMRAQEALRERERSLWQLVETLPAMIDCAAPNGEPIYRSQQLREYLGYNLEDLDEAGKPRLAGTLDAGIHPDDLAGVKEKYAYSLATGEPYARKHRLRRFDGEYRWMETRAAPMRNAEGAIVQWNVICLDIESEVRAQERLSLAQESLARASQAASLAELSASIAHEVNQPLAAIVANSHACHRWLSAEPPNLGRAKITAERIIRDANSAADVVSRIRALFRQSVETRTRTTLSSVIAEAHTLMAEEASRRRVRVDVEVEADLPLVALDRVQIQQVLINLMRNGMEAMDGVVNDRVLRIRAHRMADAVQTEITDRGAGIELPERIFEPFFTTKDHGMGMGLAICRSIVEAHGGRLWAEKNEPRGTRFVFTLPVETKAES